MPRAGARQYKRAVKSKARVARSPTNQGHALTPLDVMLDNMRFAHDQAGRLLQELLKMFGDKGAKPQETLDVFKEMLRFRTIAGDAAKNAAPYMHPRLGAGGGGEGVSIDHEGALANLE